MIAIIRTVNLAVIALTLLVGSSVAVRGQTHSITLPVIAENSTYPDLKTVVDSDLQSRLEAEIKLHPKWQELVAQKKMSVSLVDISDIANPSYAGLNGENTLYAASLPKIGILLAAFQKIHDGEIEDTEELRSDLTKMVRVSSNVSATNVVDALGGLKVINDVLKNPAYGLYDETNGGGIWVGKRYAKRGPRIGDPLKGISHAANSYQVARFYYLLATGRLVSPESSKDMLQILCEPGINHKFVASLNGRVGGTEMFRKSGSWRDFHSDSVLVWDGEDRRYILVGLVQSPDGGEILTELVPVAEKIVRDSHEN